MAIPREKKGYGCPGSNVTRVKEIQVKSLHRSSFNFLKKYIYLKKRRKKKKKKKKLNCHFDELHASGMME